MYKFLYRNVISKLPDSFVEKTGGLFFKLLSYFSPPSPSLPFSIEGLTFPYPVGIPSGWVDSPGKIFTARKLGAGVIIIKTVTKNPKKGNPYPRIIRGEDYLINSMGLPNRGYKWWSEYGMSHKLPSPVILSIKGENLEEWKLLMSESEGWVDAFEINISCPNVESGVLDLDASISLIKEISSFSSLPLWLKLSPEFSPQENLELVNAVRSGISGVTVINTLPVHEPKIGNPTKNAGKSGGAIYPLLRSFLHTFREKYPRFSQLPIFATGGINEKNCTEVFFHFRSIPLVLTNFLTQSPFIYAKIGQRISAELISRSLSIDEVLS